MVAANAFGFNGLKHFRLSQTHIQANENGDIIRLNSIIQVNGRLGRVRPCNLKML